MNGGTPDGHTAAAAESVTQHASTSRCSIDLEALLVPPQPWMSVTESDLAWMSERDAAIVQALLATRRPATPCLRILEWGSGRSTLGYTEFLGASGVPYIWLTIEHDRDFFLESVAPLLESRPDADYAFAEQAQELIAELRGASVTGVRAIVFDAGELRPFERGDGSDRDADLDDYVELPLRLGNSFDVVLIDGRKRRRCLLAAASLLSQQGIVVLHDGWRRHYQCAFSAYAHGTMLGDELWVGAQLEPDLRSVLPQHVFERHADAHGNVAATGTRGS
jgi:hypothetical protein